MTARSPRAELAHEPSEPGWLPRPPDAVLRRSRLERHRMRRLERLATTRPTWHERIRWFQRTSSRFWEGVLPRRRVLSVTIVVVALTLFDALATLVVVGSGAAEEANPLLADLIGRIGLGAAMGVRVVVGTALTLVLAWLATWRSEVRPVLALVALVLALVACLHVLGTVGRFA